MSPFALRKTTLREVILSQFLSSPCRLGDGLFLAAAAGGGDEDGVGDGFCRAGGCDGECQPLGEPASPGVVGGEAHGLLGCAEGFGRLAVGLERQREVVMGLRLVRHLAGGRA